MTWLLGALGLGLLIWLLLPDRRAHPNPISSPERLGAAFRLLLKRGLAGATLTIARCDSHERGLVFTKYIHRDRVGFTSTLASDSVPIAGRAALLEDLRQRGIRFTESTIAGVGPTIDVDYGDDVGLAQVVTRLTLRHVFDASVERDCVALFRDVISFDAPPLTDPPERVG